MNGSDFATCHKWMNGLEDATCLTCPIAHARDTDKSGSLKKKYLLFQKKDFCRRIEFWVSDISVYVKSQHFNVEFWRKILGVGW